MYMFLSPQRNPHWTGGIWFDDAARSALRLHSASELQVARTLSDAVGVASVILAVGVDSFVVPLVRGSSELALQLPLMDFESFALSSIVTFSLYDSVGRARPSYAECQGNPSIDVQCETSPTASFPSGHVNEAFTAAGLLCAHHMYLPLYGSRFADALACARDLALGAADGLLRVMGDRHYATDVLAGSAIGFGLGYGLPILLHYAAGDRAAALGSLTLAPLAGDRLGVIAVGEF
jgi:membrane-associated phospholipid phosphatase